MNLALNPRLRSVLIAIGNAVVTLFFIVLIIFGMMKALGVLVPADWLWRTLAGNLGFSTSNWEPVRDVILRQLPITVALIGSSFAIATGAGFLLVALSAQVPRGARRFVASLALPLRCLPYFAVVPLALIAVVTRIHAGHLPNYLILGAVILALFQIQAVSDYIRSERWNWLGLCRVFAVRVPGVLGTAILIGMFFSLMGEGTIFARALFRGDMNVVGGIVLFGAAITLALRALTAADV